MTKAVINLKDKQTYLLINQDVANNAETYLWSVPVDGTYEVIFRKVDKDKSLKQLGALFALWIKYIANENGESEDFIHRMLKARFLARIYIAEPITREQESWVELLAIYQEAGQQEKLKKHAKRISLSWAKLKQMKLYLNAIEQHYQAEGQPLPCIDKHWNHK